LGSANKHELDINLDKFYSDRSKGRLHVPTTFYWGENSIQMIPNLVAGRTLEVFIDGSVAEFLDLDFLDSQRLLNLHKTNGTPWVEDVDEYVGRHPLNSECVLVIGGGSASDFAKGVIARRNFGEISELGVGKNAGMQINEGFFPEIISVPTTVGSGAESSRYFVLYKQQDRAKVHGKSWKLVGSKVIIDPNILKNLPSKVLIATAFDCFVHYWESLICKSESTFTTRLFSKHGISEVLNNLEIVMSKPDDLDSWTNLGINASLAGTAISNTRTGNIHEAAGALLEKANLSHGETLLVFALSAFEQYKSQVGDKLNSTLFGTRFHEFSEVLDWWEMLFSDNGLTANIKNELMKIDDYDALFSHVYSRVASDKVWMTKESPIPYKDEEVSKFVYSSLFRFGLPKNEIQEG